MMTSLNLKAIFKNPHSDEFYASLNEMLARILPQFDINTRRRTAAFIAQCAHESSEFTRFVENLNYSTQGLADTWPRRFAGKYNIPNELAISVARKPVQIANIVYSDRMGNGDQESGDGWKYKGRGTIQITGKDAYKKIGDAIGENLVENPGLAEQPEVAIKTACAYWKINNLNQYADSGDFTKLTKLINGGFNGLQERQDYYNRALAALV